MKAEDVAVGPHPYSQAKVTLVWNDGQTDHQPEIDFLQTFDWQRITAVWSVGENCKTATLYLGMHTCTGSVWFDDIALTIPELQSQETVAEGIERRVYDDGTVLRVDGREFAEAQPKQPALPVPSRPPI